MKILNYGAFLSENVFPISFRVSLEIIGDMYQLTEAFFHDSCNSPGANKNNVVNFFILYS